MSRLRRVLRSDPAAGATLAEVLVGMAIMSMLLGLTGVVFVRGVASTDGITQRTQDTQIARAALDRITKEIRTAISPGSDKPAVELAAPSRLRFYASRDTAGGTNPPLIELWAEAEPGKTTDRLCEQVTPANPVVGANPPSWNPPATPVCRAITGGLQRSPARPLFTYLAEPEATRMPEGDGVITSSLPVDATGTVADGSRKDVFAVEIWLTAATPGRKNVGPTTLVARADLINANLAGNP